MQKLMAKISEKIKKAPNEYQAYDDLYHVAHNGLEQDRKACLERLKWLSERCGEAIQRIIPTDLRTAQRFMGLHKRVLQAAAQDDFDSYLQFVEWERDPEKKFYIPRRKVLKPLVNDLQDLADGNIDFLGVSLPPRVGKLLSDDTPVMTKDGWKRHGELKVGDYVVGLDGEYKRVEHVFPKAMADYEIEFTNGERIKCHGKHEWMVYNRHRQKWEILETEDMLEQGIESGTPNQRGHSYHFMLPPCEPMNRQETGHSAPMNCIAVKAIRKIDPVQGNCIQVEGGMYRAGKTMLPTHNSTLCIFFMTWIMGKRPEVANVMSGHSDKLTDGFYREILSILSDTTEYLWHEAFPGVQIVETSAKNETIDLDRKKRFPTMTCRSVSGTLTGAVEIGTGGILYCDDLIEDLQESLNPMRLQAKYDAYLNQLKDRKKLGARELMVGTRWNVGDPLGRIREQYADNPRYRFRVIPALNEDNESNFMYAYGKGFDTAYYMDMKNSIDDATWCAKYMGAPYIREGLLFPEDELLTYNGVLPDGEPTVLAVCDVAWGGGDSLAMPFAYVYGDEVYIHDVIFNNGDKEVTRPVVIGRILQNKPYKVRFEANNGGHEYADIVDAGLREKGFHTNISAKKAPSSNKSARGMGKVARIIQFSPDIKKFYFLADKYRSREYRAFMREVTTFVQTGNNLHDDACDSLAMLADELVHGRVRYEVVDRIW